MGRPKTYVREEVLEKAMDLFWERGFHSTSTRELADAMGINQYSLYAEFESKEALYTAAVEYYERVELPAFVGSLDEPDASLETVREVLRFFSRKARSEGTHRGCLLCNAALELAPTPEASRASTERYVSGLSAGYENALGNARGDGSIRKDADVKSVAHFLTTLHIGLIFMLRSQIEGAVLEAAVEQAFARLDALGCD